MDPNRMLFSLQPYVLLAIWSSVHFTRNKGKQQFFGIYFCSELSPAIVTNHAEICVSQQLVRSLNSNQREKVTVAKSAARQGSSTGKRRNIWFYLNILNILVPNTRTRHNNIRAVHTKVRFTHKGTHKYRGSHFRLDSSLLQHSSYRSTHLPKLHELVLAGQTAQSPASATLSNTPVSSCFQCRHSKHYLLKNQG